MAATVGQLIRHDFRKLESAMVDLSSQGKSTVLVRSLNKVARDGKVFVQREVTKTAGFEESYVRARMSVRYASGGSLSATISGASRSSTILRFKPALSGRKVFSASPWNQTRSYKKVFIMSRGGNDVPVVRVGGKLKGVYGASIGHEMRRSYTKSKTERYFGTNLPAEVKRYSQVYQDQVKSRHGL